MLSGKGCGISKTTRMLAQKQPYIQRVRNSSLVERSCAETDYAMKTSISSAETLLQTMVLRLGHLEAVS